MIGIGAIFMRQKEGRMQGRMMRDTIISSVTPARREPNMRQAHVALAENITILNIGIK